MNKFGVFVYDYDGDDELMDLRYMFDNQGQAEEYARVLEQTDIPYLKDEGVLAYVTVSAVDENNEPVGEPLYTTKENVSQEEAEKSKIGEESVEDFYEVEAGTKMTKEQVEDKIVECSELASKGDIKALELAEKLQAMLGKKITVKASKEEYEKYTKAMKEKGREKEIVDYKTFIADAEYMDWATDDKIKSAKKVEARDKNFLPEGSEVICDQTKLTWTGKSWKLAGATDDAKFLYNGEEVQFDFEGEPYVMGPIPEPIKPLEDVPEGAEGGEAPPVDGIPSAPSAPAPAPVENPAPTEE